MSGLGAPNGTAILRFSLSMMQVQSISVDSNSSIALTRPSGNGGLEADTLVVVAVLMVVILTDVVAMLNVYCLTSNMYLGRSVGCVRGLLNYPSTCTLLYWQHHFLFSFCVIVSLYSKEKSMTAG